jgi:cupin fold WbuC family metalloprotein
LLDELATQAHASPRGRAHYNIHASPEERVQRFLVVAHRHSYFRPHRHLTKAELAVVLRGAFDVLTFDESGAATARYTVGESWPELAFEVPRATWHTLIARDDGSAFLEVKEGPYDPRSAVEFAPWAPPEGDTSVAQFLERLRSLAPGHRLS